MTSFYIGYNNFCFIDYFFLNTIVKYFKKRYVFKYKGLYNGSLQKCVSIIK